MLCDRCGQREATIHEVVIKSGKAVEKHLCEHCAKGAGIEPQPNVPINELISKFVLSQASSVQGAETGEAEATQESVGAPRAAAKGPACNGCGTTFSAFKSEGLLGCPECYRSFEDRLSPLLDRAHEGGTHHVGKVPRRALSQSRDRGEGLDTLVGGLEERARRVEALRKQLAKAVESEQYERAARLRDELDTLTEPFGSGQPDTQPPPASDGGDPEQDDPKPGDAAP